METADKTMWLWKILGDYEGAGQVDTDLTFMSNVWPKNVPGPSSSCLQCDNLESQFEDLNIEVVRLTFSVDSWIKLATSVSTTDELTWSLDAAIQPISQAT